jgi:hypothetical protein
VDGDVIDLHTVLDQQLLHVPARQGGVPTADLVYIAGQFRTWGAHSPSTNAAAGERRFGPRREIGGFSPKTAGSAWRRLGLPLIRSCCAANREVAVKHVGPDW